MNNSSGPQLAKRARLVAALAVLVSLQLLASAQIGLSQVTDGDEQFQAYHQDIGRISASPSTSHVAPQTIVRQISAPATSAPVPPQVFAERTPSTHRSPSRHQQAASSQQRRPNRVVMAVRTQAPISVSPILGANEAPAFSQPAPVAHSVQPQAQPQHHHQHQSHHLQAAAPQLQAQPQPQPQQHLPQPQFQPILAASVPFRSQPQQDGQDSQPALNSFRSSAGHSQSVSARHAALMAQVAAERQAAAAAASTAPQDTGANQPSLGSPLEALSSPAVAQVQPPPTLQQQQPPAAAASPAFTFVNQPEEPMVAPSFEQVLGKGCPSKGVYSFENKDHCDRYYMCTNGTFTEEACPNGLAYSQMGAVYQHCAYNWNVDCGHKKTSEPLASPGCPWQFGIFPVSTGARCSIDYFVCEWGVPETKRCSPEGLFYDDRIKGCQWADQLGCKSEALLNFKCPPEDEDNPYWPFPRYYHTKQDVIVCVNEQPRLVHCTEEQIVDPSSLACLDLKKKKKKF